MSSSLTECDLPIFALAEWNESGRKVRTYCPDQLFRGVRSELRLTTRIFVPMRILRIINRTPTANRKMSKYFGCRMIDSGWDISGMEAADIVEFIEIRIRDQVAVNEEGRSLRPGDFEILEW